MAAYGSAPLITPREDRSFLLMEKSYQHLVLLGFSIKGLCQHFGFFIPVTMDGVLKKLTCMKELRVKTCLTGMHAENL